MNAVRAGRQDADGEPRRYRGEALFWRRFGGLAALVGLTVFIPIRSNSSALPTSMPLSATIRSADLAAVVRITRFRQTLNPGWWFPGLSAQQGQVAGVFWITFGGEYDFDSLRVVKGAIGGAFTVSLPPLFLRCYPEPGVKVSEGSRVLLLLKKNPAGTFVPVDLTLPLIPLGAGELPSRRGDSVDDASIQSEIMTLIVASLGDVAVRAGSTFLLRNFRDSRLPVALEPYVNDPDPHVRWNVLECFLQNNRVDAIPRAMTMERAATPGEGGDVADYFWTLSDRDAAPYLNPYVWDTSIQVRDLAVQGLGGCATRSSIPFLMLALRDQAVCYRAFYAAMKAIGTLGSPDETRYWSLHKEEERQLLWDWWTDEMNGKHQPVPPVPPALPTAIPDLYPYLYFPVAKVREQALEKVTASADRTSVPYLVLALQDPDPIVSYGAYALLHRLLKALGPARTRPDYEGNKDTETRPIYAWWQDELAGLHHAAVAPGVPVPPAGK
jgi:HEAT repeat protein